MGLPENNTAWPPAEHTGRYSRMATSSVWYGGDPAELSAFYAGGSPRASVGVGVKHAISRIFGWFWSKEDPTAPDDKVHVPLAQDIATQSAELVGNGLRFEVQHTLFDAEGKPSKEQDAIVAKTQARLDELLDYGLFDATLLASLETAAALGSVGLRIGYDKTAGMKMPTIQRVDADSIVPEYVWGQLTAVTFWRIIARDGEQLWYHLERHERGRILHGLYMGQRGNLGLQVPLTDRRETAALAQLVDAEGAIAMISDRLSAISVANMLPDPLDRENNAGRSDFTPGVITLFDAIDKTMTSLMRDIQDGQSKLLLADYMLESNGAGRGVSFNEDQHLFTGLKMQPGENGDAPITQVQFKIRVDEHLRTLEDLTQRAIKMCGYAPDSDQGSDGGPQTATEFSGKAKRSISTRRKKLRYLQGIEDLLETLLWVDATYFQSGVTPLPVKMIAPPDSQPSLKELAETVNLLKQAEASSIRVRVQTLHPDWDSTQIDDEVAEIQGQTSVIDPLTFGLGGRNGLNAPGNGPSNAASNAATGEGEQEPTTEVTP